MVVNAEVLTAMNGVGNVIQAAMSAERFTGAYDLAGQPIYGADHTTALDAVRAAKELAEVTKPKGGGAAINIGINNQPGANGNGNSHVKTFEQRVREKRGVLPESDVKFLSDGDGQEIIEGDEMGDDDDDDEIIDDMADGTSELEIEEAEK